MEIFEKILNGEIPCYRVYEDEKVLAFLDVFPVNRGHVLVIPKKKSKNFLELEEEDITDLMTRVAQLAKLVKTKLQADSIQIVTNIDAPKQSVFYTHVHIIPHYLQEKTDFKDFEQILTELQ